MTAPASPEQREALAAAFHDSACGDRKCDPQTFADEYTRVDVAIAAGWTPPGVSPEVMQVAEAVDRLARASGITHAAAFELVTSIAKQVEGGGIARNTTTGGTSD